jgi:hypothetical protein
VNDFISTPDSGALTLTGAVQTWTFYGVAAVDWTPAALQALSAQYTTTTANRGWMVRIDDSPAGHLELVLSTNGSSASVYNSTVPAGFIDGGLYDIQITRNASTGTITFFTAIAGGVLTQLGSTVAGLTGTLFNSVADLVLGAYDTGINPYKGTIQRFTLHDDDRLAASWSADDYTDYNATTMESVGPELYDFANVGLGGATTGTLSQTATGFAYIHDGDPASSTDRVYVNLTTIVGVTYRVTRTVDGVDGGALSQFVRALADGAGAILNTSTVDGSIEFTATTTTTSILYDDSPNGSYSVDLSVKAVTTWTLNNGAIIRDPYDMDVLLGTGGLRRHDSGAVLLDGVSGSYVSTPDSPAASVTGDCILYGYVQPSDNTPSVGQTIIAKHNGAGNQRGYTFAVDNTPTSGSLGCFLSQDGITTSIYSGTAATPYADGVGYWAFAVIDIGTNITFYTSSSPSTADVSTAYAAATQLGAVVAITQTAIFDNTTSCEVGTSSAGAGEPFNGQIHRAGIINGILPQGLAFGEDILPAGDWTGYFGGIVTGASATTLSLTEDGVDGFAARMTKAVPTVVGVQYELEANLVDKNVNGQLNAGNNATGSGAHTSSASLTTIGVASMVFTATATTTYVGLLTNSNVAGSYTSWSDISVKPTAALAVDFDARLAGLTAGAGDTFFGAEMLKPSAKTINATDWLEAGTGSITDNGDGTVTLLDSDTNVNRYQAYKTFVVGSAESHRISITLSAGTAAGTTVAMYYDTGGTASFPQIIIDWSDPLNPTLNSTSCVVTDNGDGTYTYLTTSANNSTGNSQFAVRVFPATSTAGLTGSVIVHGEVSLQAEWTLNGGAKIQNSGQAVVQARGVGGIETTVAPANIPTPMTMFMVGKADLLDGGVFIYSRDNVAASPFIQAFDPSSFRFNAGANIDRPSDTDLHLHTVRHNGNATTSYQIDSGTPVVGNAGAEEYNFGTFFANSGAVAHLTGSMGRFLLFDEELSDAEVAFIQTLLLPN